MKKILLLMFITASAITIAPAQKKNKNNTQRDSAAYYMHDENMLANSEKDATFLRLIIKKDSGMFEIQDYWMDAKPRLLARSLSGEMLFESGAHGAYTEYYPNGNKKFVRHYDHGKLAGDAEEYYETGVLKYVVTNNADYTYLRKYQDTAGKVLADNGNGTWRKYNASFFGETQEGPIVNGRENGKWKQFLGDSTYVIEYTNGTITAGKENLARKPQIFTSVEVSPSFPGGDAVFAKFLMRHLTYPPEAVKDKIEGTVTITFIVGKDGSLSEIKATSSPHESLTTEALRVLSLSPRWKPGIQNGKPVRIRYSVPVVFSLNPNK